ncbi:hypothetical protein [Kitasatospora phosalacinea]|uniref:Uncharacterized protein n=1 Tax=Kitasatospora phosalacinea TaxID=2065 RepID=A0ABW6GQA7_9ACTN
MDRQSESPDLWAFLESLHRGEILSGTVADVDAWGRRVFLSGSEDARQAGAAPPT